MRNTSEELTWDRIRGILAGAGSDPAELDRLDRIVSRRKFFGLTGRGGVLVALTGIGGGVDAALKGLFGRGLLPVCLAQTADLESNIVSKVGMIVHVKHPLSGEFLPHMLNDAITPTPRHFVRNNGSVPERALKQDPTGWKLDIDGEVHKPLTLTLDELKRMPSVTKPLMIECAGNGRALFDPPVRGNPWKRGAVGCSEWTGVRLKDLLNRAGLKESARYTAHYGEDTPLGRAKPFSRGIPIDKAMDEHTLVAYAMNGNELPALHGYPARLVVPGWMGSCSQKWLNRIEIRDREHDSQKMTGYSYRIPKHPVEPGTRPPKNEMEIVTSWNIKSLITSPGVEARLRLGEVPISGHAWAGDQGVTEVAISIDYGSSWQKAVLTPPPNRYAWYGWETKVSFSDIGYYEIWARAVDTQGNAQPYRQPWNPKGYRGNVIHRVPVVVQA